MAELQAFGVPLHRPDAALHFLFSRRAEHLRLKKSDNPLSLDITHIELDDAICHILNVGNRIHRFTVRRKSVSRDVSLLHRRRRVGHSAGNTEAMDHLFQRLYTTRRLLNKHMILLQRLRRKVKIRVKETKALLPRQVFVSLDVQPIPVYNRFAILADDLNQPPCKSWEDFLVPPAISEDPAAIAPRQLAIPHHSCSPRMDPMPA